MKYLVIVIVICMVLVVLVFVVGDVDEGKLVFGKCKFCYIIVVSGVDGEVFVKGGCIGFNFYGIVG